MVVSGEHRTSCTGCSVFALEVGDGADTALIVSRHFALL
jgi:hypothetical protein